jgi:hypothetical protein
MRRGTLPLVNL